jgi:hypothetical protein
MPREAKIARVDFTTNPKTKVEFTAGFPIYM